MDLVEKYLGEAFGRGHARVIKFKDAMLAKKAKSALKKAKIRYQAVDGGLAVGDDDYDSVEEILIRADAYPF
jgi:hypothetical protein